MSANKPSSNTGEWIKGLAVAATAVLGLLVWSGVLRITDMPAIGQHLLDIVLWCLPAGAILTGLVIAVMVWRRRRIPGSAGRSVSRVRAWWRSWFHYRRRWNTMMTLHGLVVTLGDRTLTPRLRTVVVGRNVDKLTVKMVPGQAPTDWQQRGDALAHAFGADVARIHVLTPGFLGIDLRHTDALAHPIRLDTFRKPHGLRDVA